MYSRLSVSVSIAIVIVIVIAAVFGLSSVGSGFAGLLEHVWYCVVCVVIPCLVLFYLVLCCLVLSCVVLFVAFAVVCLSGLFQHVW